jgi:hypothetical protein
MADIEDRLAPRDGLNNYHVVLARMDLPAQGGGQFTFAVTSSMLPVAELVVTVPASGQSMDRMTVDAHDALIDILRQLTFRADRARANHERNAARPPALPAFPMEDPPDLEFMVDRRARGDRRGSELQGVESGLAG